MARKSPNSRFVGYDFSEEAIARARAEAQEHGTTNVRFEVKDAATLDEKAGYDLITTFDAVHDQAKLAAMLEGIGGALRDDGVYLMQDIAGSSHLLNPNTNLRRGAKYKAVVTTGARDLAGDRLDQGQNSSNGKQPKVWFFTVRN